MKDAEIVMGETGVIYVCAECGTPVESEPCHLHHQATLIASHLETAKHGAHLKIPGFEDWGARPQLNGWQQDETGWLVTHLFLAEMIRESGFDLNEWIAAHELNGSGS